MRHTASAQSQHPPPPDALNPSSPVDLHELLRIAEVALATAREAAAMGDIERAQAALAEAQGAHDFAIALRRDIATR